MTTSSISPMSTAQLLLDSWTAAQCTTMPCPTPASRHLSHAPVPGRTTWTGTSLVSNPPSHPSRLLTSCGSTSHLVGIPLYAPKPALPYFDRGNTNNNENKATDKLCAVVSTFTLPLPQYPAGPEISRKSKSFTAAKPDREDSENQNSLTAEIRNSFLWVKGFHYSQTWSPDRVLGPKRRKTADPRQIPKSSHLQKVSERRRTQAAHVLHNVPVQTHSRSSRSRNLETLPHSQKHTGCTHAAQCRVPPDAAGPEFQKSEGIQKVSQRQNQTERILKTKTPSLLEAETDSYELKDFHLHQLPPPDLVSRPVWRPGSESKT